MTISQIFNFTYVNSIISNEDIIVRNLISNCVVYCSITNAFFWIQIIIHNNIINSFIINYNCITFGWSNIIGIYSVIWRIWSKIYSCISAFNWIQVSNSQLFTITVCRYDIVWNNIFFTNRKQDSINLFCISFKIIADYYITIRG